VVPGLVLRALRWRAALSVTVWICAVVVCAGAALGPVFALAAAESGLQDDLHDAGAATGIRLQGEVGGSQQLTVAQATQRLAAVDRLPAIAHRPERLGSLFLSATGQGDSPVAMSTRMVWRAGACAQVRFTAGRCPTAPGEAMVSARSVALGFGWRLGGTISINGETDVRVVGVYTPRSSTSPRWSGQGYFQSAQDSQGHPVTDTVFVARSTFARLPAGEIVQQAVDLPLQTGSVRLADVAALRQQVRTLRAQGGAAGFTVATDVPKVLDLAEDDQARIDAATALVVLQLCVLGWLVLHRVLVDAVEARSADIALAKLRGFGRFALVRFGLGEPVVLLLAAVPVGALLALVAGGALSAAALRAGTPVVFPWTAGLALVAAVAGGAAAIVQSAWSALRRPVLEQWRRTRTDRHGSRRWLLVDVGVAVAAAAAFVALRVAGPAAGPLTLLGPGLLVSAAGFAGARLLPVVLRPAVPATAGSRRIALFLAVRQVVRRPAGLRLVALLTVAVGLAVFGVGGEAVAIGNRDARAAGEVGAARVERLQVTPGENVVAQVAQADPHGRWAAAAATWLGFGGADVPGTVVAVDARRLAAVGVPAGGLPTPAAIAALTTKGAAAPTTVRGTRIAARITVSGTEGGPLPQVLFELRGPTGATVEAASTSLRRGTHDYRAAVACAKGCDLAGITLSRDPRAEQAEVSGTALVQRLTVDGHALDAGLTTKRAWRAVAAEGDAHDRLSITSAGLEDRFTAGFGGSGGIEHGDLLDPVPVVVGGHGARASTTGTALGVQASDGAAADLVVVGSAPVLPVALDNGVIVDLRSFQAALPAFGIDASWSVWIGPHAPADALARLRAAGLVLDGGSTLAARKAELAREGPALALLLLAVCAVAGALLAMGGTAVSIAAAVRRRSYEAAALATVGVRRGQLYRAAIAEQVLLLGTAVVVGLPAGVLALLLALPAVPEAKDDSPVPLAFLPPPLPILLCAVVLVLLVGGTVLLSAGRVVRAGSAARLRESEE
jgi:putative ABC transport system permease protein